MRAISIVAIGALALAVWIWLSLQWLCPACSTTSVRDNQTASATATPTTEAAVVVADLELGPDGSNLQLRGEVASDNIRDQLLSRARAMYAPRSVADALRINPAAADAPWLAKALAGFPFPMSQIEQPGVLLRDNTLILRGVAVDAGARARVAAEAAAALPDFALDNQITTATAAVAAVSTPPSAVNDNSVANIAAAVEQQLANATIEFETGKASLSSVGKQRLDALIPLLQQRPSLRILIRGHTDDRGSAARNLALSQRRADSVRDYLIAAGFAADRLSAQGVGEAEPITSNNSRAGRAQNRRIEMRISG